MSFPATAAATQQHLPATDATKVANPQANAKVTSGRSFGTDFPSVDAANDQFVTALKLLDADAMHVSAAIAPRQIVIQRLIQLEKSVRKGLLTKEQLQALSKELTAQLSALSDQGKKIELLLSLLMN
jgi:hypothetical protein